MRESTADRSTLYMEATSQSLKRLKTRKMPASIPQSQLDRVLELVRAYVNDARHYSEKRRHVTSLACIAYAEGLLDAMKFLELVEF